MGPMASAGARAYNGGLGQSPQRGPGAEPLLRESGGEAPPREAKSFGCHSNRIGTIYRIDCSGVTRIQVQGGTLLPSPTLPFPPLPFPSLPSPPLPQKQAPLIQLGGLGERCKIPQWGLGRSPSRQTIWCISGPKGTALVVTVLWIFIGVNLIFWCIYS